MKFRALNKEKQRRFTESNNPKYNRRISIRIRRDKWKILCLGLCCKCAMEKVDAEEYYRDLMETEKEQLTKYLRYTVKNIGCAFLTFRSSALVHELLDKNMDKDILRYLKLSGAENARLETREWKFRKAPTENDIIWKKINKIDFTSYLKISILCVILFIISVVLVTPLTVIHT